VTLPRLGITTSFVDSSDFRNLSNLKLFEPGSKFTEFKIYFSAHSLLVASPYLLNPIEHGATIVIHSLTKYIAGNGTSLEALLMEEILIGAVGSP
jgi:O-acetylhomoserine (thiol)-lyase